MHKIATESYCSDIIEGVAIKECLENPKGIGYAGTTNETNTGLQCQRWDSQTLTATSGGVWGAMRTTVGILITTDAPGVTLPHPTNDGNTVIYRYVVRLLSNLSPLVLHHLTGHTLEMF